MSFQTPYRESPALTGLQMSMGEGQTPPKANEFQAFASMLRRRKWIVILVMLFGGLNAFAYASLQKNVYQASVLMRVDTASSAGIPQSDQINASIALAKTFVVELTNGGFIQQAARKLQTTPSNISSRVSAGVVADAPLIRISVTGATPRAARTLAQDYADYSVSAIKAQYLVGASEQVGALQKQSDTLSARIRQLVARQRISNPASAAQIADQIVALRNSRTQLAQQIAIALADGGRQSTSVQLAAPATGSKTPISPRLPFDVVLGLLVGLLVGVLLAWVRDQLDRSIHDLDEVEQNTRQPVLATVPLVRDHLDASNGVLANAYDVLRVSAGIVAGSGASRAQVIAITSAREGEGKSSTVIGLGRSLVRSGRRVLLIDADLRRAGLSHQLEMVGQPGLTEVLRDGSDLLSAIVAGHHDMPDVLPAGSGDSSPPTLLDSLAFEELLDRVRHRYETIVIDTPPSRQIADGIVIASKSDAVILVVRLGLVRRDDLAAIVGRLSSASFRLLGEVVYGAGDEREYGYS
ncbi:MAG TPA: polysaccharide biosynthesis tyrosine autokinase [Gaiellales bacterium]|jgi:capsular exopolysaccharide synthesis family protein|nr:polysaccharide biosynthesis tyrosine autokinase [Gaiellales bacterium]